MAIDGPDQVDGAESSEQTTSDVSSDNLDLTDIDLAFTNFTVPFSVGSECQIQGLSP